MIPLELFYGVVTNNDDPLTKGRLQIRVLPEMSEAVQDHLPWLEPFFGGQNTKTSAISKEIFDIGAPVWCFFDDKSFDRGWYITGVFLEEPFDIESIRNDLSAITEDSLGEQYDISFSRFKNGTIEFKDNSSGYMGIYHASGSYAIFDSNGGIIAYSKSNIKLYTDNNTIELNDSAGINIDAGTGNITFNGSGNTLVKYSELADIITAISMNLDSRLIVNPVTGIAGPVQAPFVMATFNPLFETNKINMEADTLETS